MSTGVGVSVGSAGEALRPTEHVPTILCFSHLRWEFVFQRPQHLLTRFARKAPVIVWEEPIDAEEGASPSLHIAPPPIALRSRWSRRACRMAGRRMSATLCSASCSTAILPASIARSSPGIIPR